MKLTAECFEFELPMGWRVTGSEDSTIVATGDRGQTLRATAVSIKGPGSSKERAEVASSLRMSARRAMRQIAADFEVTGESRSQLASSMEADQLDAQSPAARLLQCAVSAPGGVLLLSVEGALADADLRRDYLQVLGSIAYRA